MILAGDGRVKLDDEVLPVRRLDAIRVAPGVDAQRSRPGRTASSCWRSGPHRSGDGEPVDDPWVDRTHRLFWTGRG